MTLTDFLIIYLAFGAPLAVYKYLQNRAAGVHRRVALSIFTFFFWVPVAFEIGYLYFANAYFRDAFVSHRNSDASDRLVRVLRESITIELIKLGRGSNVHGTREVVDRYTGLANEVRYAAKNGEERNELFEAAGRENYDLGQLCLMRRNLRRLEKHHIQARRDFVELVAQVSHRSSAASVFEMSVDLAGRLDDHETVGQLRALKVKRGEVWSSGLQEHSQIVTSAPPIAMTASLNND
ncbi:MAG TPA: hypothetical protein VMZ26_10120 [Pyrinomonadaceae bacterium]|nr:hypothetical protein [Pyrinomonadaceae bacterium]